MNTTNLLDQAKKIMTTYVCRDLDGDEKKEMDQQVQRFFDEKVTRLSKSEIMDRMATPMKALDWFNTYVCESFWDRCCCGAMPDDSDTCMLAH